MTHLQIEPKHLFIVLSILIKNLPDNSTVWVFGSRAQGRAKKFSDLDLAIDAHQPLTLEQLATLTQAFDESELPYKVDVIDWLTISDSFRQKIDKDRVKIIPKHD